MKIFVWPIIDSTEENFDQIVEDESLKKHVKKNQDWQDWL